MGKSWIGGHLSRGVNNGMSTKKRALEEGSGSWEERRGWEREEDELRGKLLQNPRRPEGRWKQEDRRELG